MEHNYLIYANHRERIEKLVELIHGLNGFGTAKFEDMVQVSTEDDNLAGILDQVLGPYDLKKTDGPHATNRKTGKTLEKRICSKCHNEYQPVRLDQKKCSDCSREASHHAHKVDNTKPIWFIPDSNECLSNKELQERLAERTLPVGMRLDHETDGAHIIAVKGEKYFVEKVLAD